MSASATNLHFRASVRLALLIIDDGHEVVVVVHLEDSALGIEALGGLVGGIELDLVDGHLHGGL